MVEYITAVKTLTTWKIVVDLVVTRVWLVHWALVSLKIIQVSKKIQNAGKIQSAGRIQNAGKIQNANECDRLLLSAIFTVG